MGVRLESTYYTEKGVPVLLRLWDSSFSGAVTPFSCERLSVSWRGDDDRERFSPVVGSELRMSVIVDSSALETFMEDLVGAEEGRFTVSLGIFDGLTARFTWNGYITVDNVSLEDTTLQVGYRVEIRAVDGLGRLKDIDYNNAGTAYTGKETFIAHILNCLNKLDFVTDLFPGSAVILRTVANWHEDSYTYASTINPLARSRVSHNAFYYRDTKGNTVFSSCYDVLTEICKAWGARLFYSGSSFWLTQVNEMAAPTALTVFNYTAAGTESVSSSQNLSIAHNQANLSTSSLIRFSGGFFQFFLPYKLVQVDYKHIQSRNLLAGYVWSDTNNADVTVPDIDSNGGDARLSYSGVLTVTSTWINVTGPTFQPHYIIFALKVQVGSFFLNGDVTVTASGAEAANMEWNNVTSSRLYVVTPVFTADGQTISFPLNFLTPLLQQDGDLTVSFDKYKAYYGATEIGFVTGDPNLILGYQLTGSYMELLADGTFEGQSDIYRYCSESNKVASKKLELVTSIGDGPNLASPGHIEVLDDSDEWVLSNAWRVGNSGDYKPHSQILVNEIIRGQITPVKRLGQFSFQNLSSPGVMLLPHLAINYDSAYWVFQDGTFDIQTEIFSGNWYKLQTDSDYTEKAVLLIPKDSKDGPPTSGTTGGTSTSGGSGTTVTPGGTTGNIVRVFRELFADQATSTLTITENGGALPFANQDAQVQVFMNGQKLWPSQYTITAPDIVVDADTHYAGANYEVIFTIIS